MPSVRRPPVQYQKRHAREANGLRSGPGARHFPGERPGGAVARGRADLTAHIQPALELQSGAAFHVCVHGQRLIPVIWKVVELGAEAFGCPYQSGRGRFGTGAKDLRRLSRRLCIGALEGESGLTRGSPERRQLHRVRWGGQHQNVAPDRPPYPIAPCRRRNREGSPGYWQARGERANAAAPQLAGKQALYWSQHHDAHGMDALLAQPEDAGRLRAEYATSKPPGSQPCAIASAQAVSPKPPHSPH